MLREVGGADDGGARADVVAVRAGGELRGDALRELHLAQGGEQGGVGAVLGVERVRLDVHRARDVVSRADDVVHELVGHVVLLLEEAHQVEAHELAVVPEVVMRIHDLEPGLESLLLRLRVPGLQLRLAREPNLALLRELLHPRTENGGTGVEGGGWRARVTGRGENHDGRSAV